MLTDRFDRAHVGWSFDNDGALQITIQCRRAGLTKKNLRTSSEAPLQWGFAKGTDCRPVPDSENFILIHKRTIMTCDACKSGNHEDCAGECDCRQQDEQINQMIGSKSDMMLAEMVYSNVLYSGSREARMLTDGAGKQALVVFIQQVLRAQKAIQC
jgi:hypothetical protein